MNDTIELRLVGTPQGVADLLTEIASPALRFPVGIFPSQPAAEAPQPAAASSVTNPPAIGDVWPGQGGIYAGLSRGADGLADAHLILAEKAPDTDLGWDAAVEWAQRITVDGHVDFRLPTRAESALLFANLRDKCEPRWHWTGEQYSRTNAWHQYVDGGYQYYDDKSYEGRARAVRRFIP